MSAYHLAQLNVALLKAALDSPQLTEFRDNLDRVNAIADAAAGFVWRWITPPDDTSEERVFGTGRLVNVSVWDNVEALRAFVYQATHREFLQKRALWFDRAPQASMVLWWVPAGHRPSLEEAAQQLAQLQGSGPTPEAFTFVDSYPAPDRTG